jgi:hypothetical protein
MKIVKILLISIWILLILGLALYVQALRVEIKYKEKMIGNMIYLMQPPAEMYSEYFRNISYLRTKSGCKQIADSIFNSSDFLKTYEIKYLKQTKK